MVRGCPPAGSVATISSSLPGKDTLHAHSELHCVRMWFGQRPSTASASAYMKRDAPATTPPKLMRVGDRFSLQLHGRTGGRPTPLRVINPNPTSCNSYTTLLIASALRPRSSTTTLQHYTLRPYPQALHIFHLVAHCLRCPHAVYYAYCDSTHT